MPTPDYEGLRTDLIGHYRLDNNLVDTSGNGRDLTSDDATFSPLGLIGQAMETGTTNWTGDSGNAGDFTIGLWIKIDGIFSGSGPLFGVAKTSPLAEIGQCEVLESEGSILALFSDGVNFPISSGALSDGWHRLLFTRSGHNCEAFVDAVSVGTFTNTLQPSSIIGHWGFDSSGSGASCLTDEGAVWSKVLTQDQILADYNNGFGYDPTATPEPAMPAVFLALVTPLGWIAED